MKYLSIDIEATGLNESDLIIEFAMVPFCTETKTLADHLAKQFYVQCPSFEELRPRLDTWVVEHNEGLIRTAHSQGVSHTQFKQIMLDYVQSSEVKSYFNNEKIVLFGKSMNAIDLPFLNRDLGWDFMRKHFHHRQLDLTSFVLGLIDLNFLPKSCTSGSELMRFLGMGEVKHTALEDARNTAIMHLRLLEKLSVTV